MKVTIDFPDSTVCAHVGYVFHHEKGLMIGGWVIPTREMYEGSEIKIVPNREVT